MKVHLSFFRIVFFLIIFSANLFGQEEIWDAKGQTALQQGNYDKAIENFNKAIKINGRNKHFFYNRGLAYLYSSRFDTAVLDFSKVIELDDKYADAYNNRGLSYNYMDRFDSALTDFNKAIALDSNFTEAYINRGSAFLGLAFPENALTNFDKAIRLDSNNPAVFVERGRVYYKTKKYNEAISDFTKAIKLGLKNGKIYYNRGNSYYSLKKYTMAIDDYTTSFQSDTMNSESLNNRAISFDLISQSDKHFLSSIINNNQYQQLLSSLNNPKKSKKDTKKNISSEITLDSSNRIIIIDSLITVYRTQKDAYKKFKNLMAAYQNYTKILAKDTANIEALFHRSVVTSQLGESDRKLLYKLSGNEGRFKPIDSLKFVPYSERSGQISLLMPENWHTQEIHDANSDELIITFDRLTSPYDNYSVGIKLSITKNMDSLYKVKEPVALLDFWKGSTAKNSEEYFKYDIMSQKTIKRGDYIGSLNKTRLQVKQDYYPLKIIEVVLAKTDVIFYAYFQAPEVQFGYYEKIFEKAIESLIVK